MTYNSPLLQAPLPALTRRLPVSNFMGISRFGPQGLILYWLDGSDIVVPQAVLDAMRELTETNTLQQAFQQVRTEGFFTLDVSTAICLSLFVRWYRLAQHNPTLL